MLKELQIEISKLGLNENDILIFKVPDDCPQSEMGRIGNEVAKYLDKSGFKFLIMPKSFEIAKIPESILNGMGYFKANGNDKGS